MEITPTKNDKATHNSVNFQEINATPREEKKVSLFVLENQSQNYDLNVGLILSALLSPSPLSMVVERINYFSKLIIESKDFKNKFLKDYEAEILQFFLFYLVNKKLVTLRTDVNNKKKYFLTKKGFDIAIRFITKFQFCPKY